MPITTEQILIEFIGDASGMEPAIDSLEKVGSIDKAQADAFKKVNAEYSARAKSIDAITTAQKKSNDESAKNIKTIDELSKKLQNIGKDGLKSGLSDIEKGIQEGIIDALNEAGVSVDQFTEKLVVAPKTTDAANKSLRAQLFALKEEISKLDKAGQENTQMFEDLSVEASKLENQIRNTEARIRALASTTRNIDTLVSTISGIAGAFTIAQGAVGLFGKENDDVQQALLKVNSAMAILQGLTELQNIVQKENIAVQTVSILQRRAQAVSIQLESAAESSNIIVKGAATAAQWALNAAMAANPAGILLGVIVAISAALVYFTSKTSEATDKQNELNTAQQKNLDTLEKLNQAQEQFNKAQVADAQQALDVANATNKPLAERLALEKELLIRKLEGAAKSKAFYGEEIKNLGANIDQLDLLREQYKKLEADKADKEVLDIKKQQIDNLQREVDTVKKITDEYSQANREIALFNASSSQQLKEQSLKDAVTMAENRLLVIKQSGQDELAASIDIVNKKAQEEIFAAAGNAAKIRNIELQRIEDISKLKNDAAIKELERERTNDEALLEIAKKNGDDLLNLQIKIIEDQMKVDLQAANITAEERLKIEATALGRIYLLRVQAAEKEVGDSLALEKADAERRLAISKEGTTQRIQAQKDLITNQEEAEILAVRNSLDNEELKAAKIAAIQAKARADREKLDTDSAKKIADEELKYKQDLAKYEVKIRSDVFDFVFNQGYQYLQTNTNNAIVALNAQRDKELSNKKLTEEQKAKIEEKYRKEEARIKNDAAKRQRAAELIQATINGYLAVSAVLQDTTIPSLVKPIAITQAIITNGLQIAAIAATPLPKYRYGVERLQGPGSETSDSIVARLSKNERVVPADVNNDYFAALSAIHNRKISPAFANAVLGGLPPSNVEKAMIKSLTIHSGGVSFDERKFAKIVAAEMVELYAQMNSSQSKSAKYLRDIAENTKNSNSSTYDYHRR